MMSNKESVKKNLRMSLPITLVPRIDFLMPTEVAVLTIQKEADYSDSDSGTSIFPFPIFPAPLLLFSLPPLSQTYEYDGSSCIIWHCKRGARLCKGHVWVVNSYLWQYL